MSKLEQGLNDWVIHISAKLYVSLLLLSNYSHHLFLSAERKTKQIFEGDMIWEEILLSKICQHNKILLYLNLFNLFNGLLFNPFITDNQSPKPP